MPITRILLIPSVTKTVTLHCLYQLVLILEYSSSPGKERKRVWNHSVFILHTEMSLVPLSVEPDPSLPLTIDLPPRSPVPFLGEVLDDKARPFLHMHRLPVAVPHLVAKGESGCCVRAHMFVCCVVCGVVVLWCVSGGDMCMVCYVKASTRHYGATEPIFQQQQNPSYTPPVPGIVPPSRPSSFSAPSSGSLGGASFAATHE